MSLINQALKKAQRQRAEADGSLGMFAQSGRGLGRSKGLSMQAMILGGLALVTLSVVLTVMLVSRKSEPKPAAKPIASAPPAPAAVPAQVPAPAAAVPLPSPAVTISLPPPSQPTQPAASEEPIKPAPVAAAPAEETPVQAPPESKPSPTIVFPHHDDAIQAIVDGLQVTGYRALGADSKVIIAGKIIRINNVVDHASGLRLTKVDPMSLTFVDATGETYVRNF